MVHVCSDQNTLRAWVRLGAGSGRTVPGPGWRGRDCGMRRPRWAPELSRACDGRDRTWRVPLAVQTCRRGGGGGDEARPRVRTSAGGTAYHFAALARPATARMKRRSGGRPSWHRDGCERGGAHARQHTLECLLLPTNPTCANVCTFTRTLAGARGGGAAPNVRRAAGGGPVCCAGAAARSDDSANICFP